MLCNCFFLFASVRRTKIFAIVDLFYLFLLLLIVFEWTGKSLFTVFHMLLPRTPVTSTGIISWKTLFKNIRVENTSWIWNFEYVCEQGMPCSLERYVIKSHDPFIMCSPKTSTTTVRMATNLSRNVTYFEVLLPVQSHGSQFTWSLKITWQIKNISLRYHKTYGHQACQGGGIHLEAPTHKLVWFFSHMVLWRHVAIECIRFAFAKDLWAPN